MKSCSNVKLPCSLRLELLVVRLGQVTSAGLLTVRGQCAAGLLVDLVVELKRPAVTRLFVGQTPAQVVKTVPHLYTLCAQAQGAAADAAIAAATGVSPAIRNDAALWVEMLHENFWRLLLDWPVAVGLPAAKAAFIDWRTARHGPEVVAKTQSLVQRVVQPLAEKCLEKLVHRSSLPVSQRMGLNSAAWLAYWRNEASAMPEVIPPTSVAAAYQARLAAVDAAAAALANGAVYPIDAAGQASFGVGQILTARGVLTHAVQVVAGRVEKYQVWAPTDVFFRDATALSAMLAGQCWGNLDQMRQAINQAILALDPCLPYVMELNDA